MRMPKELPPAVAEWRRTSERLFAVLAMLQTDLSPKQRRLLEEERNQLKALCVALYPFAERAALGKAVR